MIIFVISEGVQSTLYIAELYLVGGYGGTLNFGKGEAAGIRDASHEVACLFTTKL